MQVYTERELAFDENTIGDILSGQNKDYNLVIYGVANTIATKTLLAQKFSFSVSEISRFEVIGQNIFAKIDVNYTPNQNAFQNNTDITAFIDLDGSMLGVTNLGTGVFLGCTNLETFKSAGCTYVGVKAFRGCTSLDYNKVFLPNVEVVHIDAFRGTLLNNGGVLNLPKCTDVRGQSFYNARGVVNLPKLVSINYANFENMQGVLNITSCTGSSDPTSDESIFNLCTSNLTVNVNESVLTNNGGAKDEDFVQAESNGVNVNYLDSAGIQANKIDVIEKIINEKIF